MAEKAHHDWVRYLNLDNLDLGSGKRSIVADGVYVAKYQITVPKALEAMPLMPHSCAQKFALKN
jgi:hypothetical protein